MSRKKVFSAVLAVFMSFSVLSSSVIFADDNATENDFTDSAEGVDANGLFVRQKTYSEYYDEMEGVNRPDTEVLLNYSGANGGAEVSVGSFEGVDNAVIWSNQTGTLDFTADILQPGTYNIEVCYFPITGGNTKTEISVLLDGVSPYETATRIQLPRIWASAYPITTDSKDNEIRPPQVEKPHWITEPLKDVDGLFNNPLIFYLDSGTHTISLDSDRASFAIAYIKLYNESGYSAYIKPSDSNLSDNAGTEPLKIQGEDFLYTTSQSIYPIADRGDYKTEPSHPTKQRYNAVFGGESALDSVTWGMTVDADGWYKIGIKARQDYTRGMYSNRRLLVDGEVPCEELSQVKFYYDAKWVTVVPEDENGNPVYVYLTEGKHELTLEVIPGEIGESMRRLNDIVFDANQLYMKILMITGPTPDKYTDYYVYKEIPELLSELERLSKALREEQRNIESLSNQKGSEAAVLDRLAEILDKCVSKKDQIPNMVLNSSIKNNIAAVASWMRKFRFQPLDIDFIEITPAGEDFTSVESNFFKNLSFGWKSFYGSFIEDYTVLSDMTKESINVWVGLSREQATVVKRMVDSDFNINSGYNVSINLVQGGIMEAVLAGKGPDASLFVWNEFPINLAIRNLALPFNDMEGFDEVMSRFHESASEMFTYDDKLYAIPMSQNFPMMFYRKDMLASVGISEPPETWDDLIDMLPAFQRAYMQPGLILPGVPAATGNATAGLSVSPAIEIGHTFTLLMLQNGISYYNDDLTATNFESQEAVDAFTTWTDFYNVYKFDQTYDAFTRFRTGEAPIVIKDYSGFYNQLSLAAPEIAGLWDFTLVPGIRRADGTVSHAANYNATGAVILKDCKNVKGAWEFIKWFTDTDNMIMYGQDVEGLMGPLARFESANVEALKHLNWSQKDLDKILAQMEQLEGIPIIPSAYVVTRSIMNAFRAVVNDKWNPRETIRWYNIDINSEITRKRKNLGLDS